MNHKDYVRPLPEPKENIGNFSRKQSHIVLDGINCQVLNPEQWKILKEKILDLQNTIGVNIMISFFEINSKLD